MKLNGTHKFKATSTQVFSAILNPEVLQASIPGAKSVSYTDANTMSVAIAINIPGISGTFELPVVITRKEAPHYVDLHVARKAKGGAVNALCKVSIVDEADGALLTYDANAELEGVAAMANNPIGSGIVKKQLGDFFKKLDQEVTKTHV